MIRVVFWHCLFLDNLVTLDDIESIRRKYPGRRPWALS